MSRVPLSKKTRFGILSRDHFTCRYCGRSAPDAVLQVDHVIPVSEGGDNRTDNLITSCLSCNLGKGVTGVDVEPEDTGPIVTISRTTVLDKLGVSMGLIVTSTPERPRMDWADEYLETNLAVMDFYLDHVYWRYADLTQRMPEWRREWERMRYIAGAVVADIADGKASPQVALTVLRELSAWLESVDLMDGRHA